MRWPRVPKYFRFGGASHSPDHRLHAWSADLRGSEYFSIRVRAWADGQDAADLIEQTDGRRGVDRGFKRVLLRPTRRKSSPASGVSPPARHVTGRRRTDLSGAGHRLVHAHLPQRQRPLLRHRRRRPRNLRVPVDRPLDANTKPRLVAARETGIRYSVEDRGDELFILTNADSAIDYKIAVAPLDSPAS